MTVLSVTAEAGAENIPLLRNVVAHAARTAGVSEERLYDVKLCVTEAATNVVKHAYAGEQLGAVRVDVRVVDDELEIEVADDGRGMDPDRQVETGGYGLGIIYQLTDCSSVRTAPGSGVRVRMSFLLADGRPEVSLPWEPRSSVDKYFVL